MKANPYRPTAAHRRELKKEINRELNRQIAENIPQLSRHITAIVLWSAHEEYGSGKKKLLQYYNRFIPRIKELQDRYEMNDIGDMAFLCNERLKTIGIDIDDLDGMIPITYRFREETK